MPILHFHTRGRHVPDGERMNKKQVSKSIRRNGWLTNLFIIFLYLSSAVIYLSRALEREDVFVSTLVIVLSFLCVYLVVKGELVKEKAPLLAMIIIMVCEEVTFIVINYGTYDATWAFTRLFIPISFMYRYTTINDMANRGLME